MLLLYDLEKAYDSIEHPVLLKALFEAGLDGKARRIVKAFYGNLQATVNVNSIDIVTIIINFPYSPCISSFLAAAYLLLCSFYKCFFGLYHRVGRLYK